MQFLIIGDALSKIKAKTDSSLSMAREALSRGHTVHWCTPEDLYFWEQRVWIRSGDEITQCDPGTLPLTEILKEESVINSYDGVWIRKDPPFDNNYLSMCWMLALEENNVPFTNKPSVLLRYHEKMLPFEAIERGFLQPEEVIPSFIPAGRLTKVPKNFPKGESVSKPWLGFGGQDVKKIPGPQTQEPFHILQPLVKEVSTRGDRRVFFINGEMVGSFVRIPPAGEIKSNIASGGTGIMRDLSKKEQDICHRLEEFLKELKIDFAGVDLLAEKVSEINITSPTGLETYYGIGGPRLAPSYLNFVESLV